MNVLVRESNTTVALVYLAANGYGVMSPISQGHPIAETGYAAGDWQTWEAVDKRMVEASDGVVVLNIHGLMASVGVRAEVVHAATLGKPLSVMTPLGSVYGFVEGDAAVTFLTFRFGLQALTGNEGDNG